jgi:CBS domain-containing protein
MRNPNMEVQDLMTRDVATCMPDTTLRDVAHMMWNRDCGFVPVVDPESGQLCGVLTDRDACLAAFTKGKPPDELKAGDAMVTAVHACHQGDDLHLVHEAMRQHKIRRMVVVDAAGKPVGIVSLHDLALNARKQGREEALEVMATLGEICQPRTVIAV